MKENEGIEFNALLSGIRTDGRTGAFKITLDVFPDQAIQVMAGMTMYMKHVSVTVKEIEDK